MTRPTIGVIFRPTFPPELLPDYARRAEDAGFDELWLWNDAFLPGALTSAAVVLANTKRIVVGIGLLPAMAFNPQFVAMDIVTLERLYPGRLIVGFGYGVDRWMQQTGAAAKPSIKSLEETVIAVRRLLAGETVTMDGTYVHLDEVKMKTIPASVPPLYIGGMREKTLRLAGRVGDGTILVAISSPAYVSWCKSHIDAGLVEGGMTKNRVTVFALSKVNPDGAAARNALRPEFSLELKSSDPQFTASGILQEARSLFEQQGRDPAKAAPLIPEAWIEEFTASGTPEQAVAAILKRVDAGADAVILQPMSDDPDSLDEYIRYLMPVLKGKLAG